MEPIVKECIFGDYKFVVSKSPVNLYVDYTNWHRTLSIYTIDGFPVITNVIMNDLQSYILATCLYVAYTDYCSDPYVLRSTDQFGNEEQCFFDFEMLSIINPYFNDALREEFEFNYEGFGIMQYIIDYMHCGVMHRFIFDLISDQQVPGKIEVVFNYYNPSMTTPKRISIPNANTTQFFLLAGTINDDIESELTNFVQNNM